MMYSFGQRTGCHVIDEPFYARYLLGTGLEHPGRKDVLNSMPTEWKRIQAGLDQGCRSNQEVFLKDMAHHIEDQFMQYLEDWKPIFLIRNPAKMIRSFAKVIHSPTLDDLGIVRQSELFNRIYNASGKYSIVVDADTFLMNPEGMLKRMCKYLEIEFSHSMLSWLPGPIPEDGVWAKYWYKNVHSSKGFVKPNMTCEPELDPRFSQLLESAMAPYNRLLHHQILE